MASPIWRDIIPSDSAHSGVLTADVQIRLDSAAGTIIHNGRVEAGPTESKASIRINDIIRPYLFQEWPNDLSNGFKIQDGLHGFGAIRRTFAVLFKHGNYDYHVVSSPDVQLDYSYDLNVNYNNVYGKSHPIKGVLDSRQELMWTTLAEPNFLFRLWVNGASTDYGMTANDGTAVLDLSDYPGLTKVEVLGSHTYYSFDVDDSGCHRYVLYYVNAHGGWDSMLIDGKTVKRDSYERSTHGQVYDNYSSFTAGTKVYKNQVTRRWELHTDWLTDVEASRMHHLLGTTLAMLYDFVDDLYYPVIIRNSECVYKEYATNGHKMASYVIEAELARDLTRR